MKKFFVLLLAKTACIINPTQTTSPPQQLDDYQKLEAYYTLVFEQDQVISVEELYQLEELTREKLASRKFTSDQRLFLRGNHHKLKSLLIFLYVAKPVDFNGILGKGLLTTFFNHLRAIDPKLIDLNQDNDRLFKLMKQDKMPLIREDQQFFAKFLKKTIAMTEENMKKYHKNFPFAPDNWRELCPQTYRLRCREFDLVNYHIKESYTLQSLTEKVNRAIVRLNKIITELTDLDNIKGNWWVFSKVIDPLDDFWFKTTGKRIPDKWGIYRQIDFADEKIIELYQEYDLLLAEALADNILPIFFSKIFQRRSGDLYLQKESLIIDLHHKLLTKVTPHTVKVAVSQLKKRLVDRWVKLQELTANKKFSEQQIYDWISNNEVPATQILLQDPRYSETVSFLIKKYKNKRKEHELLHTVRDMLLTVGTIQGAIALGTGVLFSTGILVALAITAIIVGHIQNFGEVGLISFDTLKAHGRYRMLEGSLLSGTTMRAGDAAELLREFKTARRKAIFAGAIGLPLNAAAIFYILRNLKIFTRIAFVENFAGWLCNQHENGVLSDEELIREN